MRNHTTLSVTYIIN